MNRFGLEEGPEGGPLRWTRLWPLLWSFGCSGEKGELQGEASSLQGLLQPKEVFNHSFTVTAAEGKVGD